MTKDRSFVADRSALHRGKLSEDELARSSEADEDVDEPEGRGAPLYGDTKTEPRLLADLGEVEVSGWSHSDQHARSATTLLRPLVSSLKSLKLRAAPRKSLLSQLELSAALLHLGT